MKERLLYSALATLGCWLGEGNPALAQDWTWSSAPTKYWESIASSADGARLVAVAAGFTSPPTDATIYVSTNSGGSWFRALASSNIMWQTVACSADGSRMVAAASGIIGAFGGPICSSADGGMTWALTSAPSNFWRSVASSADGVQLAAAANGLGSGPIYTSTNSGATWVQSGAPVTNWAAIASSADGMKLAAAVQGGTVVENGYLVNRRGLIYASTNGGAIWRPTSAPGTNWYAIASSADGTRLAAAAFMGLIYTSIDSGATWKATSAPSSAWIAIASSADGRRLLAGADDTGVPIYCSDDSGMTWTSQGSLRGLDWSGVASSADGNLLVATTFNGGIARLRSTPQPKLGISRSRGSLTASWTVPSANYSLQYSITCGAGWTDLSALTAMNLTNLRYEVVVPATNSRSFYRLESR